MSTRRSRHGLETNGLEQLGEVHWNLATPSLFEHALRRGEASIGEGGALVTRTGAHTGRAAGDKFTVREAGSENEIWWGKVNRSVTPEQFERVHEKMRSHFRGRDAYVQDCYAGADREYRLGVRVVTEQAWHSLFARNMFIQPADSDLPDFRPGFTVLHAPELRADPATDGTNSEVFILVSLAQRTALIGGTWYAGEIKKSVFSVLNYLLPARGVLPMHCSVNVGPDGDTALFFGLSGTGKTTLSADPRRRLVGDDEHGWSEHGVFNFEGGCYAKVIRLSEQAEPQIYATTRRFGTILENVVLDDVTGRVDLDDPKYTENTRASYPLSFIDGAIIPSRGGHPRNIFFLTCDAFGVLPPISRLTPEQTIYHFLSGYTAKVAGTEKGVKDPTATFSTCFGAPFLPRFPWVYARMLGELTERHATQCWLVNTGWTGGPFGVGRRMKLEYTRATLDAALSGALDVVPYETDRIFGLRMPERCPDVPRELLRPDRTWSDADAYESQARVLASLFRENFAPFENEVSAEVAAAGPA